MMKELMKDKTLLHNIAFVTAVVCGAFSLFVAFQLISNCVATKNSDPLNMELFSELRLRLQQEPDKDLLIQEIRDLDVLARRSFFSSISFQSNGTLLLLAGVIMTLIPLKYLSKIHARMPHPDKFRVEDKSIETAVISRNAIWSAFGIIIALTLITGLQITPRLTTAPNPTEPGSDDQPPAAMSKEIFDISKSWPNLRGPYGIGIASGTNAPTDWDGTTGRNILWKTPVPRAGFSSPIVVDGRVFLSCGDNEAREVVCFDADTGSILWQKAVGVVPGAPAELPEVMEDVSFAASTMATDGERVFALFATGNVICFDLHGNREWARSFGPFDNEFGHGASLITYRDKLIVQLDEAKRARILALSTSDGKTLWETKRNVLVSWSTPILADTGDSMQLILNGNPLVAGYDPETGRELWTYECMGGEVAPSPAFANGLAYVTTEYQKLFAIKPGTVAELAWQADGDLPDVSSPLAVGDFVFIASSSAVISCYDAKDGNLLWKHEPDSGFFSSPVLAGGNVYIMDKEGKMHIFEAASAYKPVGTPELGEEASCTPAFIDNRIYIRGKEHLYCIGIK